MKMKLAYSGCMALAFAFGLANAAPTTLTPLAVPQAPKAQQSDKPEASSPLLKSDEKASAAPRTSKAPKSQETQASNPVEHLKNYAESTGQPELIKINVVPQASIATPMSSPRLAVKAAPGTTHVAARPRPHYPARREIYCKSSGYRYNQCYTGLREIYVRGLNQESRSPCIYGETWGYDYSSVWVNNGCRAVFFVEGYY